MGMSIYVLRCADGHYYVGSTKRTVEERVQEHSDGSIEGYTKPRRRVTLVYSEYFDEIVEAIALERQLKGWSRAKKEALIAGRLDLLPNLSRSRRPPPSISSG